MTAQWTQALAALAAVLALAWGLAALARRRGLGAPAGGRLGVVAACAVDARRRLVILRCDGREALVLLSPQGDTMLGWVDKP